MFGPMSTEVVVSIDKQVSKNDEYQKKNEEFGIRNDEFCRKTTRRNRRGSGGARAAHRTRRQSISAALRCIWSVFNGRILISYIEEC